MILRLVYQKAAVSRILKLFRQPAGKNSAAVFAQPGHLFGYTEAVLTSKEGDVKEDLARIEQFLDALWLERNLAENTLSAYRRDLTMVVEWLHHRELSLVSASGEDLQALLAERQTGGYKATSTARLLSAVRRFFQHLYREKIRSDDPSALLASPKLPQRLPKDLSEAQVERLLQAPLVEQPLELRDKAMLEVLYATGLRVSELVGLTMSDISLRQGVLRVVGKGNKERLVPLGEEAVLWVENYLEYGRPGC